MGRPARPTALKIISGNPGKRKLNRDEPKPTGAPVKTVDWTTLTIMDDLASARERQWSALKIAREAAQESGCDTALGRMDTDKDSQRYLTGTVQMAQLAEAAGQPFSIDWTMADNSVVTHDAAQIIAAGVAVGQHIAACHATGQALRADLDAADTLEAIWAVVWRVSPA